MANVPSEFKGDPNLDILRAMAVLGVLIAHCLPYSRPQQAAGHFAVLIFFVHTALVLLLSLQRQSDARCLVRRFYIQRVFRIYPLSILCVLITLAFRISWPNTAVFSPPSGLSIGANLLLVQNFLRGPSISSPMWSLPFEIQMYAVLPVVFWVVRKRGLRGAGFLLAVSVFVAMAELMISPLRGRWLTCYATCFMGGALAFARYGSARRLNWRLWILSIAAIGFVYCITANGAPADWLACVVLGLILPFYRPAPGNLLSKAASLVARYSYGIYLSHVPLIWLCRQKVNAPEALQWLLFSVLLTLVSAGVYHLIEAPMIRVGKAISSEVFGDSRRPRDRTRETANGAEREPLPDSGRQFGQA